MLDPATFPRPLILVGTGHRLDKIGSLERVLKREIVARLLTYKPQWVISGMALGWDQWLVEMALVLSYPYNLWGMNIIAAIPCAGQESLWPAHAQVEYRMLLARIQKAGGGIHHVSTRRPRNHVDAAALMNDRDVWMVDQGNFGLAGYNGDPEGGTANTVRYMRARKMLMDVVNPDDFRPQKSS